VLSGCTSFWVFASSLWGSCTTIGVSSFVASASGYWISSSISVGFIDIVSGDGISSISTIFDCCCSFSSNDPHDLVWTRFGLALWLASDYFGGAIMVPVECLLGSNNLCDRCILTLWVLVSITLCLFSFDE
jgi:hypothetical protein